MGIRLLEFKLGKERVFEQDVLNFASVKYGSEVTKSWTVTVMHVKDPADWIDLFDVARYSHMDPATWPDSDAYSITWDIPTLTGVVHLRNPRTRRQLANRMPLTKFGTKITKKAAHCDLATFLNDSLLNWLGNLYQRADYSLYVLTHEALHSVEDWTGKHLVVDGVPPSEDTQVAATLEAYIKHSGGWDACKKRYLL